MKIDKPKSVAKTHLAISLPLSVSPKTVAVPRTSCFSEAGLGEGELAVVDDWPVGGVGLGDGDGNGDGDGEAVGEGELVGSGEEDGDGVGDWAKVEIGRVKRSVARAAQVANFLT